MRFTVERAILLKALNHVQSVVERRNTIPILANILIDAREDGLTLTATDMEIAVVERVAGVQVTRPGRTTAPASTLYDIVRKLSEGARIDCENGGPDAPLNVRSGRFSTNLPVLPVDDFPSMTEGKLPHGFALPGGQLRDIIDRTRFAISTEETRYYLNGIFLHATEDAGVAVLRAVATDGHRLARVQAALPDGARGMPGVIVPRKTIAELRKLAEETTDVIDIRLSDTKIRFDIGPVQLTSKLIDGTFPEYERVIPRNNDRVLTVRKRDFAEAVARVAAISSERTRPVKLSVQPGQMEISASSPDAGDAREVLDSDVVTYTAAALDIGFQARYLSDITDQIDKTVRFSFADGQAPTMVEDDDGQDDDTRPRALYVLMPMRV